MHVLFVSFADMCPRKSLQHDDCLSIFEADGDHSIVVSQRATLVWYCIGLETAGALGRLQLYLHGADLAPYSSSSSAQLLAEQLQHTMQSLGRKLAGWRATCVFYCSFDTDDARTAALIYHALSLSEKVELQSTSHRSQELFSTVQLQFQYQHVPWYGLCSNLLYA